MLKKKKLKTLNSSLREKKRYVAVKFYSNKNINFNELISSLKKIMVKFLGVYGLAKQNLKIIKFNEKTNVMILRTTNKTLNQTIVSLLLLKKTSKINLTTKILSVSGSLKKIKSML